MTSGIEAGKPTGRDTHRRETFRYIVLPMIGVTALVAVGLLIVLFLPKPGQLSIIADWMFTVFCMCPAVLCLFPIVIGLIAAVAGMNKVHASTARPMEKLEELSATLASRVHGITETINRRTANASVRFAFLDRLLSIFDPPTSSTGGENEGDHVESDPNR